jgi:hypothetical protein
MFSLLFDSTVEEEVTCMSGNVLRKTLCKFSLFQGTGCEVNTFDSSWNKKYCKRIQATDAMQVYTFS